MGRSKSIRSLSKLFLENYIFVYITITITVVAMMIFIISNYINSIFNTSKLDIIDTGKIMNDNYEQIDSTRIEELNGFIQIVDKYSNVIYQRGKTQFKEKKYTAEQYNEIFQAKSKQNQSILSELHIPLLSSNFHSNMKYIYECEYNNNKGFLLVVGVPTGELVHYLTEDNISKANRMFIFLICICIGVLLLIFIAAAHSTSKIFIKPFIAIAKKADEISQGRYDTELNIKSSKEFLSLGQALNNMSKTIKEERELKEKSEENRKNLILGISHDLKNPLSSTMGYSQYILNNKDLSEEEKKRYLTSIYINSKRSSDLIDELFQISKLDSSEYKLSLTNGDICEFIRKIIASYIPQLEEKAIMYEFDIPDGEITVSFDEKNMDRALSNLIVNSIKYGSERMKFNITLIKTATSIKITVEDDGTGIPVQICDKIFEPFVRVDDSVNIYNTGTGLGLAITKKIIEMHGGTIIIDPVLEKGTRFIIELPATE